MEKEGMSRREALKTMGLFALGSGLAMTLDGSEPDIQTQNQTEKKMKVMLVNGSPHKNGCTFTALSEIAETLRKNGVESEFFWIGNKPVSGCIACRACAKTGRCILDDAVNRFLDRVPEFDGFVFGAPVHFASPNGMTISFMDRVFFCDFNKGKNFAGKPGAAIASCRRAGSSATLDVLNKYFVFSKMPLVPSQYWPMVHGGVPEDVKKDIEGLQIMRTLGQNMAWLLKCIAAGKAAGIDLPQYEPFTPTNFIR